MAAKKKATAKPTRTGAETKSYTNARVTAQNAAKANQKKASAAHAGKSGKSGKTAIASAELKSGLRARNRLNTTGSAKNPPRVKMDSFDYQEQIRNRNKGYAAGIPLPLQRDFRGKARYNSTQVQTYAGNNPVGFVARNAVKVLAAMPTTLDKLGGKSGRTAPISAEIFSDPRNPNQGRGSRTVPPSERNEESRNLSKKKISSEDRRFFAKQKARWK